eukprot:Polyplicarium_translucidae@DN3923_c0_g1_i1.p1
MDPAHYGQLCDFPVIEEIQKLASATVDTHPLLIRCSGDGGVVLDMTALNAVSAAKIIGARQTGRGQRAMTAVSPLSAVSALGREMLRFCRDGKANDQAKLYDSLVEVFAEFRRENLERSSVRDEY